MAIDTSVTHVYGQKNHSCIFDRSVTLITIFKELFLETSSYSQF